MAIALLVALLATTVSGLMVYAADQHAGPLAAYWLAGARVTNSEPRTGAGSPSAA